MVALIITIPAYKGNHAGLPVAFLAVTSISVIGLYIAYIIPVYLRWRMRDKFEAGPWTLGAKYKWINLIAIVWVILCVIIFSLPFTPAAVPFGSSFTGPRSTTRHSSRSSCSRRWRSGTSPRRTRRSRAQSGLLISAAEGSEIGAAPEPSAS